MSGSSPRSVDKPLKDSDKRNTGKVNLGKTGIFIPLGLGGKAGIRAGAAVGWDSPPARERNESNAAKDKKIERCYSIPSSSLGTKAQSKFENPASDLKK